MGNSAMDALLNKGHQQNGNESKKNRGQTSMKMTLLSASIIISSIVLLLGVLSSSRYQLEKAVVFKSADGIETFVKFDTILGDIEVCSISLNNESQGSVAEKLVNANFIIKCTKN